MYRFAADIGGVRAPASEMVDRPLWTVRVKNFQLKTLTAQYISRLYTARRRFAAHYRQRLLIAVNSGADEVIGSKIFGVDYTISYKIVDIYEASWKPAFDNARCADIHLNAPATMELP